MANTQKPEARTYAILNGIGPVSINVLDYYTDELGQRWVMWNTVDKSGDAPPSVGTPVPPWRLTTHGRLLQHDYAADFTIILA
jgi:hypothetical protein